MTRQFWKPANLLYPIPAALVTCCDEDGKPNIMTAAWTGTICSDPVMVYVSIRKQRHSHDIIARTGEFVLNLTNASLAYATDFAGVRSGKNMDKLAALGLATFPSRHVKAPGIAESPVCLECKVENILALGSHDMFIARVLGSDVDDKYLDENGKLDLEKAGLIAYSHGAYHPLGKKIGTFGYSVRKKKTGKKHGQGHRH